MTQENTAANIAAFVNTVWADALLVARANNVMAPLVTTFGDLQGLAVRKNAKYGTLTFNQIAETDDLASQAFTPSVDQTLTPYEYGAQVFMTDSRIETDIFSYRDQALQEFGVAYGQKLDSFLVGLFPSFTGGSAGGTTTNMNWANFFEARARMQAAFAPMPWRCVLSPAQYMCLGSSIAPGVTVTNAPQLQDEFIRQYYVNTVAGVDIYVDGNITAAATVAGGMFSPNAMALDMRRALRIEQDRDPSKRGVELNASSVYAYGVWRPQYGVVLLTAGTIPVG